jgi:hypothetical protein
MSSFDVAAPGAALLNMSARAQASRRNGAKSRGPATEEGKARSSQNALKHDLRAQTYVLLQDEDEAEFEALEAALTLELAPEGALQRLLAQRIARAAWRLARADRMETELFEREGGADGDLGLALIRDGNGARAFLRLLRYRGAALAELWRALRTLKALQAEAAPARDAEPEAAPMLVFAPDRARAGTSGEVTRDRKAGQTRSRENPIEPEIRRNPGGFEPARAAGEPEMPQIAGQPGAERDPGWLEAPARAHGIAAGCSMRRHDMARARGRRGSCASPRPRPVYFRRNLR